eukprot:TRINITY_DN9069_c0_g1_i1.p1 TRINITY_DN9069_c0_g1~~TRINITY_DN9069_c0_g1_i1.p1  ORF type:complete len:152 (-),score=30.24 TRINITY_DN9069_c0_g1_i1:213-668(-)
MSEYHNVIGGKLKLKGKALDVKAGGMKKKKKHKQQYDRTSQVIENELSADLSGFNAKLETESLAEGGSKDLSTNPTDDVSDVNKLVGEGHPPSCDDHLTPAEKRYIEQRDQLDVRRLARISNKSHRDRILDFNQYLANLSEHYDIPKVGPG